jgi:hypothetical protein
VNNIEELMTDLVKSSVALKRKLYRRDEAAATSPEGTDAPTLLVHTCMVCERSAAGEGAQVRHEPKCALARLQAAQKALREGWPELFAPKPSPATPAAPPAKCVRAPERSANPMSQYPKPRLRKATPA